MKILKLIFSAIILIGFSLVFFLFNYEIDLNNIKVNKINYIKMNIKLKLQNYLQYLKYISIRLFNMSMQIKKTKYIMYHCDPGCSGFADRVKGKINFSTF